ncbi:VOC family protein [Spongisporangium articulatum]|uniref:VOC family protein n=1 Tax=Spongisporangium articulatum TaxID=3362603 RepID=A0ABW8AP09_9ACTN
MSTEQPDAPTTFYRDQKFVPDLLAHFVVKTARPEAMIRWYGEVFGAEVVHQDKQIAFLTWDDESHRLALVKVPKVLRFVFPFARYRRKAYGVDHLAFTYHSIEHLLVTYKRLKRAGILPVWTINHGPTTSLYYEDPDGIRLEFQVENFATAAETAQFFGSPEFAQNPIGVEIDPDYLLERLIRGDEPATLLRPGAGTRPGTTPRANKRTITWKTL